MTDNSVWNSGLAAVSNPLPSSDGPLVITASTVLSSNLDFITTGHSTTLPVMMNKINFLSNTNW